MREKNKKEENNLYEAPRMEFVEVQVEQGFSVSMGGVTVGGWGDGGSLGGGEADEF